MCARYTLTKAQKELMKTYSRKVVGNYTPNYNIAPTASTLVITADEPELIQPMHFGLVPFWATNTKMSFSTINAREEEIMEKKTYAPLVKHHKTCLILADGFYEWDKKGGSPVPYYFTLKDRDIFAFAGLWSEWKNGEEIYRSFTMLTTESNQIVGEVHCPKCRMPVILSKDEENLWLDKTISPSELLKMCNKYPDELMNRWQVSTAVNNVRNAGSELNKAI